MSWEAAPARTMRTSCQLHVVVTLVAQLHVCGDDYVDCRGDPSCRRASNTTSVIPIRRRTSGCTRSVSKERASALSRQPTSLPYEIYRQLPRQIGLEPQPPRQRILRMEHRPEAGRIIVGEPDLADDLPLVGQHDRS